MEGALKMLTIKEFRKLKTMNYMGADYLFLVSHLISHFQFLIHSKDF